MIRHSSWLAFVAACAACSGAQIPPRPRAERIVVGETLVAEYYRRVNAEDLPGVLALLAEQPVLVEPFSSPERATVHTGYTAVARFFDTAFRSRDDQVVPEFVDVAGPQATVGWSLHGADGAGMSGATRMELRAGQIARIEIQRRE